MKIRKMNLKTNQRGSALPFVIILGLVLLVLIAALATVATGTITFTQESVESRQAYLDAKSVTEYGKVLIDDKITEMQSATLDNKAAANSKGDVIFYIKGVRANPLQSLTLEKVAPGAADPATDQSIIGIGKLSWEQTAVTGDEKNGTATTSYTISVESTNLARKLDYRQSFDYVLTTSTTGSGIEPPPSVPTITPAPENFGTQTKIEIGKQGLECKVTGEGYGIGDAKEKRDVLDVIPNDAHFKDFNINLTGFEFIESRTLNIAGNQVAVSVAMPSVWNPTYNFGLKDGNTFKTQLLYFAKGYTPDTDYCSSDNTLKAKDIVIIGDLNLANGSTLNIDCENLWVTGNVNLTTQTDINQINAKNIVISGKLTISDVTKLTIDCPKVWIGSVSSGSNGPQLIMQNVKSFKTGNMLLTSTMALTINGDPASSDTNQVEVGSIETKSTGQHINITDVYSFNCLGDITQGWSGSTINIEAKVVTIGGNLTLTGINGGEFKISTQYFTCKGNTHLEMINGPFYIGDAAHQTSAIRFEGNYEQINSQVTLYGAQNIVFNGSFQLGSYGDKATTLISDNIYFQSQSGPIDMKCNQWYHPNTLICRGVTNAQAANVLLKTQTVNPSFPAGKYIGYTNRDWSDKDASNNNTLQPGDFTEIAFPDQPGGGGKITKTPSVKRGAFSYY
jgi:hypothetical protein